MPYPSNIPPIRILGLCALFLWSACQQKSEAPFAERSPAAPPPQGMEKQAEADRSPAASASGEQFQDAATHGDIFSSAAAVPGAVDSLKKFIRSAQMRFRVDNAVEATLRIEDIVLRQGGFVVRSNLNSEVELRQATPLGRDSALETTCYSIHSQLVVRVPFQRLDTTLRSIGKLSDFLDLRHVNTEDVGLQMLEQELARVREGLYRRDLEQSEENKISPKADRARASRAATDQARIETLKLEDAIRFSTVRVDIYQLPQIRRTVVANTEVPLPQQPFAARLAEALRRGGEVLVLLLLGAVHLWGVVLLATGGYFAWKWFRSRTKSVAIDAKKSS